MVIEFYKIQEHKKGTKKIPKKSYKTRSKAITINIGTLYSPRFKKVVRLLDLSWRKASKHQESPPLASRIKNTPKAQN